MTKGALLEVKEVFAIIELTNISYGMNIKTYKIKKKPVSRLLADSNKRAYNHAPGPCRILQGVGEFL